MIPKIVTFSHSKFHEYAKEILLSLSLPCDNEEVQVLTEKLLSNIIASSEDEVTSYIKRFLLNINENNQKFKEMKLKDFNADNHNSDLIIQLIKNSSREEEQHDIETDFDVKFALLENGEPSSTSRNKYRLKLPSWWTGRLALSWDFYPTPEKFESDVSLGRLPLHVQESMIIEDLLLCMHGIEGKHIKTPSIHERSANRTFHIDRSLDMSLRELAKRILPLCVDYSLVIRFVEKMTDFSYGYVCHALCFAIYEMLKNYFVFLAQLQTKYNDGNLSLLQLWCYSQPIASNMSLLASVVRSLNSPDLSGAFILDVLHNLCVSIMGDTVSHEILLHLTQSAASPYLRMVSLWINKGLLSDPYGEFMVVENDSVKKETLASDYNYWLHHYSLNPKNIPIFLAGCSEKVLRTGKYLKTMRESGHMIKNVDAAVTDIIYNERQRVMEEKIEKAYRFASFEILKLLLQEHHLVERLACMKQYFFIEKGDFLVQFLDTADEEIRKDVNSIVISRLETLLDFAIRSSSCANDPYKDDLRVILLSNDLITILECLNNGGDISGLETTRVGLTGHEALTLDYNVEWPLSLVVNTRCIQIFQLIFGHMFYIKHVERQLNNVWLCNKVKTWDSLCLPSYSSALALRQRMLNFVQNILYYMSCEVFEPNWHSFVQNVEKVLNIDELIDMLTNFTETCFRDCMLKNLLLIRIIHKLLAACIMFANYMQKMFKVNLSSITSGQQSPSPLFFHGESGLSRSSSSSSLSQDASRMHGDDRFSRIVNVYSNKFSKLVNDLFKALVKDGATYSNPVIMNILHRLDFNRFYRDQFEADWAASSDANTF